VIGDHETGREAEPLRPGAADYGDRLPHDFLWPLVAQGAFPRARRTIQ
jgi:hypothetical protein